VPAGIRLAADGDGTIANFRRAQTKQAATGATDLFCLFSKKPLTIVVKHASASEVSAFHSRSFENSGLPVV